MSKSNKDSRDKKKSVNEQSRDKYWQIRVRPFLDDRLEQYMENKGIRNKSDFIRNLVIFYLDLTGDDFTSLQEWRDFVEALTD